MVLLGEFRGGWWTWYPRSTLTRRKSTSVGLPCVLSYVRNLVRTLFQNSTLCKYRSSKFLQISQWTWPYQSVKSVNDASKVLPRTAEGASSFYHRSVKIEEGRLGWPWGRGDVLRAVQGDPAQGRGVLQQRSILGESVALASVVAAAFPVSATHAQGGHPGRGRDPWRRLQQSRTTGHVRQPPEHRPLLQKNLYRSSPGVQRVRLR